MDGVGDGIVFGQEIFDEFGLVMVVVQVEEIMQDQYLVVVCWVGVNVDGWYCYGCGDCSGYWCGQVFQYYEGGVCFDYGFGIFDQLVGSIVMFLYVVIVQMQY